MTRYDLAELDGIPLSRQHRRFRPVLVGVAVFAFLLGLFVATSGFRTLTGNWSAGKAAFLVLPALLVATACLGFATAAPGAVAVEVTDTGVAFAFPNGRVWRQPYAARDFRLPIERAPALGPRSSVPVPVWVAWGPGLGTSFITEAAYNDILERARALGLTIRPAPARFRGERVVITAAGRP